MASKSKVKMLLNLGWLDARTSKLSVDPTKCLAGEVVSVDEHDADVLVNRLKCAEPVDSKERTTERQERSSVSSGLTS